MIRIIGVLLVAVLCWAGAAQAQEAAVERVEVRGNQFLQKETILYYVTTKAGGTYSEEQLKGDFRRLWDTGFLDDLRIDSVDGASGGKVVTFTVKERPRVLIVDFRGSKALSKSTIEDELKKRESAIRVDSFYDPAKVRRVEEIIKEMLIEKGRPFGTVKTQASVLSGGAGRQVSFIIEDGAKAQVKQIDFVGNKVFSDGDLKGAMKKIKERRFWNFSWLGGKNTFTEEKWTGHEGDYDRIQSYFLNRGYVAATIGRPVLSYYGGNEGKKPKKDVKIEIPVTEGEQYRVGEVKMAGLTVFKEEGIRTLFKLKTGDIYNESRIEKGYEKIRDFYGAQGYFQMQGRTDRDRDDAKKIVNVTLNMDEDKRYYVGRISFTGNDTTRDKVIRREVYLNETDVFNTELLKLSIRRINQLGYFKPMEGAPELLPSEQGEDKLDIKFKVEEQNRNQFTFGGGVSGLEGTFINSSFSTSNFLGAGETFQISAQRGGRTKAYQFALTEPYLFDRPITAGIDLFASSTDYTIYGGYREDRKGVTLTSGFPVGRWSRIFPTYSYQVIEATLPEGTGTGTTTGGILFDPSIFAGKRRESRFSPSYVFNSTDNPYSTRSGMKHTATFTYAGGPLGGTLDYIQPSLEAIFYVPHWRKTALGLRGQGSYLVDRSPTGSSDLTAYLRFLQRLGGEYQVRGYDIRTIGPVSRNSAGAIIPEGGNKVILFNAEYYFDVVGPLRLLAFADAGQVFRDNENVNLRKLQISTGLELRFIMPVLNVPFRLIYARNPNVPDFLRYDATTNPSGTKKTVFKFAIGTTF
jgi:outer membrane protein insertion porin family